MLSKSSSTKKVSAKTLQSVLEKRFRLRRLREGQREVIEAVLSKKHTLALMPTGAGKSLCFQLPAVLLKGKTLVVSPLIALMRDQKEHLDKLSIATVELDSALTTKQQNENLEALKDNETEFIYVTPERLTNAEFLESLKKIDVDLMVIDEAHCVSQWGHDFRPAYLALKEAWTKLKKPTILALTATATSEVVDDIQKQLGVGEMKVFSSGVLRDNLFFKAVHIDKEVEKNQKILEIIKELSGSGIIYCATVRAAKNLKEFLNANNIETDLYHGKLSSKDRIENRERFMAANDRIMIATNAFGMGIDKPNIRFVLHYQFPGSLEAYYQEAGRAGRDGKMSECILLYLKQDKRTQNFFLMGKYPTAENVHELYAVIQRLDKKQDGIINESELSDLTKIAKSKVKVILSLMKENKVIKKDKGSIKLLKSTLSNADVEALAEVYKNKKFADDDKLKQMIIYAQSALCRWKILLRHFDHEVDWERCGHCDNCLKESSHLKDNEITQGKKSTLLFQEVKATAL